MMKLGKDKINLLPHKDLQARYKKQIQKWIIVILLIEMSVFIGNFILQPYAQLEQVEAQLEKVSMQLKDDCYINVNQKIKRLEEVEAEVEKWQEKYQILKKEQVIDKQLIDSLFAPAPRGLTICSLTVSTEEDQIVIEGIAQQAKSILNYQSALEGVFSEGKVCSEFEWDQEEKQYSYVIRVEREEEAISEEESIEENNFEEVEGESGQDEELNPDDEEGGVGQWIQ